MKLMIDISNYDYQAVKRHVKDGIYDYNGLQARINKAIANGVPFNTSTVIEPDKEEPYSPVNKEYTFEIIDNIRR